MALPSTTRSLPMSLVRAREAVMIPIRAMLHKSGLTEQQWRILRVLEECGPIDATKLSRRAGLLAPSLTRIIDAMSEKELVSRQPDPNDRRRQVISLLPDGKAVIDDNQAEAIEIAQGFRDRLGDENYEDLLDLLDQLIVR